MAGWIMTENPEYAGVHNNSGEFTYGQTLCPGTPSSCSPYVSYSVKANIEEGANFDSFIDTCGSISKALTATGCNEEMLVMWFNQGTNKSYNSVLDDNSIFDIKNVDECEHIIISDGGIREGGQNFEDASYVDSGFPSIATDPCSSTSGGKYAAGTTYSGHKIKYHVISDTIPANFYEDHDELVELYFPHLYTSSDTSGKNTKVIGEHAFNGCTRLSAVTFSAVERIGESAFWNCTSLKLIDWGHASCITSKIQYIEDWAFDNCSSIEVLCLDKLVSIRSIGDEGFARCTKVTTLNLPTASTYTVINTGCFRNVGESGTGISSLVIPNNITEIGNDAFDGHYIKNVTIPSTVTKLGCNAFNTTKESATNYTLKWNTASQLSSLVFDSSCKDTIFGAPGTACNRIYVPSGMKALYASKFGDDYYQYIEEM